VIIDQKLLRVTIEIETSPGVVETVEVVRPGDIVDGWELVRTREEPGREWGPDGVPHEPPRAPPGTLHSSFRMTARRS